MSSRSLETGFRDRIPFPEEVDRNRVSGDPLIEGDAIQGNGLVGFSKDRQAFIFLEIVDIAAARQWIQTILPWIATLQEVRDFQALYTGIRTKRGHSAGTVTANWINVAFSYGGLAKLRPDTELFKDAAFKEGMGSRAKILGDPTGKRDAGNPDNWVVGRPGEEPDALLILACDDNEARDDFLDRLMRTFKGALRISFVQFGDAPPIPDSAHEQFGFRDGISQPGVRGRLSKDPSDFLTARQNPANPDEGKPGQPLIWPGEFVFGYPGQDPSNLTRAGAKSTAGPSWADNGSFLVFRRYRQNVKTFRSFLNNTVKGLRQKGLAEVSDAKLGAMLLGRWSSGEPILRFPHADSPEASNELTENYFNYRTATPTVSFDDGQRIDGSISDPTGAICPFAAHIRRAYPRDDLTTRSEVETHRIIRRGIPFGPQYPAEGERGLVFVGYLTSIERQFEFVLREWFNNPDMPISGAGYDPIVGQNRQSQRFVSLPMDTRSGQLKRVTFGLPDFVTVTGGGYFFVPSIPALSLMASADTGNSR